MRVLPYWAIRDASNLGSPFTASWTELKNSSEIPKLSRILWQFSSPAEFLADPLPEFILQKQFLAKAVHI